MKKPKGPKPGVSCTVKQIESANPKKRERKEKDTVFEFDAGEVKMHGVLENLQAEGGIDAFLMTVADARECNGLPRMDEEMRTALMEALNG